MWHNIRYLKFESKVKEMIPHALFVKKIDALVVIMTMIMII